MKNTSPILPWALALLAACSTTSDRLAELHAEDLSESTTIHDERSFASYQEHQEERRAKVRTWAEEGRLRSAEDLRRAAEILIDSDRTGDIELAGALAEEAATLGEAQALPLVAEATDRLLVKRGQPQMYGTQYRYDTALGTWSLYPWDPATTDEERQQMGVPTLVEALERARWLNTPMDDEPLPGDAQE